MSDADESTKAAKKASKAKAKLEKKLAKLGTGDALPPNPAGGATAAERSAAAAERQVKLQFTRVLLALLMVAIAVATFLVTQKPWQSEDDPGPGGATPTSSRSP